MRLNKIRTLLQRYPIPNYGIKELKAAIYHISNIPSRTIFIALLVMWLVFVFLTLYVRYLARQKEQQNHQLNTKLSIIVSRSYELSLQLAGLENPENLKTLSQTYLPNYYYTDFKKVRTQSEIDSFIPPKKDQSTT